MKKILNLILIIGCHIHLLAQDKPVLDLSQYIVKDIKYYDLVSRKVNQVSYQRGRVTSNLYLSGDNVTSNAEGVRNKETGEVNTTDKWNPTMEKNLITDSDFDEGFVLLKKNEKGEISDTQIGNISLEKENPWFNDIFNIKPQEKKKENELNWNNNSKPKGKPKDN